MLHFYSSSEVDFSLCDTRSRSISISGLLQCTIWHTSSPPYVKQLGGFSTPCCAGHTAVYPGRTIPNQSIHFPSLGAGQSPQIHPRSRYKGRAQGGQKLASGKGGKPTQQQPTAAGRHALPEPGQASGRGGANGNSDNKRRSKWGDAPGAGVAFPVPASDRTPARDEGRQGGASDREGKPNDSSKWSRSGGSRADGRERGHEHEAGDGDRRGQGRRTEVGQSRGGDVGSENHVGDSAREADRRDGQRREQGGSREAGSRNRGGRDAGRDHGSKNGTRRRDEDETERRDSRRKDDNRSYRSSTSGHRTDRGRGVEEEVSARSGGRKDGKDRDSHRGNDREHRSARKRSRSRSRDRGRGGGGGRDKDGRRY